MITSSKLTQKRSSNNYDVIVLYPRASIFRRTISERFAEIGFKCFVTDNGRTALEHYKNNTHSVKYIFATLNASELDGGQVAQQARKHQIKHNLPHVGIFCLSPITFGYTEFDDLVKNIQDSEDIKCKIDKLKQHLNSKIIIEQPLDTFTQLAHKTDKEKKNTKTKKHKWKLSCIK